MVQMTIFLNTDVAAAGPDGAATDADGSATGNLTDGLAAERTVAGRSAVTPAFDPHEIRGLPTHERRSLPGPHAAVRAGRRTPGCQAPARPGRPAPVL